MGKKIIKGPISFYSFILGILVYNYTYNLKIRWHFKYQIMTYY